MSTEILVVDDSPAMGNILLHLIQDMGFKVDFHASYNSTKRCLQEFENKNYLVAILDLALPDANNGEIVDLVQAYKIPVIVLTSSFDEKQRQHFLAKGLVDYLVKEGGLSYDYLARIIKRLDRNRQIKALVVDDSRTMRTLLSKNLNLYNFQVLQAENGLQALDMLAVHPDIELIVTDYNMPKMDGFALVAQIRQDKSLKQPTIIGLSAEGNMGVSARFLKYGADDFLKKPFADEEFHCRVMQNIEMRENLKALDKAAHFDALTGLHNRRSFNRQFSDYVRQVRPGDTFSLAMLDIDFFKAVNDEFGHDAGDLVLQEVATIVRNHMRGHLSARFGGEEFVLLLKDCDEQVALVLLNNLCRDLAARDLDYQGQKIQISASIGISCQAASLSAMLKQADLALYQAKSQGRNRVVCYLGNELR